MIFCYSTSSRYLHPHLMKPLLLSVSMFAAAARLLFHFLFQFMLVLYVQVSAVQTTLLAWVFHNRCTFMENTCNGSCNIVFQFIHSEWSVHPLLAHLRSSQSLTVLMMLVKVFRAQVFRRGSKGDGRRGAARRGGGLAL